MEYIVANKSNTRKVITTISNLKVNLVVNLSIILSTNGLSHRIKNIERTPQNNEYTKEILPFKLNLKYEYSQNLVPYKASRAKLKKYSRILPRSIPYKNNKIGLSLYLLSKTIKKVAPTP